jgi:hypothetical protein
MTQFVDFEVVNDGDSVFIVYSYCYADAPLAEAACANFVPIPHNGINLHPNDAILFNRQPTLHRMSMMCHIVKVMTVGDTFRMNVACTKPYNADELLSPYQRQQQGA